jgi:glucose-1-phosphate thymidylyltransferase
MQPVVVILAGGAGTRFAPFVTNKTMWTIGGIPLIKYTIDAVVKAGFNSILVVTNASNDSYINSLSPELNGVHIETHIQAEPKGMDDALMQVKDILGNKPIFVVNGIDMVDTTLFKLAFDAIQSFPRLLVCGRQTDEYLPVGYYVLKDDKVVRTVEKPSLSEKPSNIIRLVADYFHDASEFISLFGQFSDTPEKDSTYEQAQTVLLQKYGADLITYTGPWAKLKYPHYVLDVMNIYLHGVHVSKDIQNSNIHATAVIDGAVYIDPTAKIEAYAVIKGPSYIGRNVIVGNHSLIRQSMIEEGSTIGFGSEVARSYVGPGCNLHHTFVGDSVLESKVNLSWGTVTANLRLDSKTIRISLPNGTIFDTLRNKLGACIAANAFLGVGVSTMPGTIVGSNINIAPHTVVKGLLAGTDNK